MVDPYPENREEVEEVERQLHSMRYENAGYTHFVMAARSIHSIQPLTANCSDLAKTELESSTDKRNATGKANLWCYSH